MKQWERKVGTGASLKILLAGLLLILMVSVILLSCVPPISKDALVHHLAVPKLYLEHGGMYEIPHCIHSYFPMNVDLMYIIPLYFGNDVIPKFVHFFFGLLTAWLLFDYVRRRMNTIYGLLGALFFLSIPIIVKLSITVYVDLGLTFFSTASLLFLLKWLENQSSQKYLILSAVFCGLAMGTKYNGLIICLLLTFFVPLFSLRYTQERKAVLAKSISNGFLFMMVAFIVFSPWMLRNFLWTHNPVFPMYDRIFNPESTLIQKSQYLFEFRRYMYHETWWHIALIPLRIFFQGQDGNPQFFDGVLNPFLLLLPLCAFFRRRTDSPVIRREKNILFAFSLLFFAFAFFGRDLRIRYLSVIIPPLVILSMYGIEKLLNLSASIPCLILRRVGLIGVTILLSIALGLNARYVASQYAYVAPFEYLQGSIGRDEYIARYRSEYPALMYVNTHLPQDSRILFLFVGKRGYYCDRNYVFDMDLYRESLLGDIVRGSKSPETVQQGLKRLGITHLLFNYDIFKDWAQTVFSDNEQQLLRDFFNTYGEVLFDERGYGLVRVTDPFH
ncbi:MAG: glycosyltransferase family 39 protein [Gemmatimonadota bacterium]|nr:MAG: glycosyltransferase family 39 protein [Gemmatimonadota bacterium]